MTDEGAGSVPVEAAAERGPQALPYFFLLTVAMTVVFIDQVTKHLAQTSLSDGRFVDLFGGLLRLDYTENTGAAFSVFRSGGSVFVLIAIVVSVGILVYYRRAASAARIVRIALGLILGGALGNLVDRVRLGYVVDFIDLRWWPVFNLADSAIVIGVALLLLSSLKAAAPLESR